MKKTMMILTLGLLFIAVNLYAEGNLIVNGQLGVASDPGSVHPSYKLVMHNPDTIYRATWLQLTTTQTGTSPFDGLIIGIESNNEAQLWSEPGMPIIMFPGGNHGNHTIFKENGRVGIGTFNPMSKLAVKGLPTGPPDNSGTKGIVCITNDGNMWIDVNSADGVCN